jgi:hypothetical protein
LGRQQGCKGPEAQKTDEKRWVEFACSPEPHFAVIGANTTCATARTVINRVRRKTLDLTKECYELTPLSKAQALNSGLLYAAFVNRNFHAVVLPSSIQALARCEVCILYFDSDKAKTHLA